LVDEGSAVESAILARQRERGEFPGRLMKPDGVERPAPKDDGKERTAPKDAGVKQPTPMDDDEELGRGRPRIRRVAGVSDLRASGSGQGGQT
jgi:hypothetical protein